MSVCGVIALFLATLPQAALARQEAANRIDGTIVDQAEKSFPNAIVTVKNDATGQTANTTSAVDGHFFVSGLAPGVYTVEVSAPGFAITRRSGVRVPGKTGEALSLTLNVASLSQSVNVEATVSMAAQNAPVQNTLDARSAKSVISPDFVKNFISPVSDFSEIILMAPGTFSVNPNGVGLGQAKTYFRGFADGQYTMTFDGIPFEDTNSPTHHSWAFFPSQWVGATDFDRSPGTAATIGPTNFGGSINMQSREVPSDMNIQVTGTYASFNTRMVGIDFDSGEFGPKNKSSLFADVHQLLSDGYQTFNRQKRDAGALKYQYKVSDKTTLTVFGGLVDLWTNTPNFNGPSRSQVALFGDDFLLSGNPSSPLYYGYDYYHIQTDFEYLAIHSDLGSGWTVNFRPYTYRYWNKQNYNNSLTSVTATSGVDKLNGYRKVGDIAEASWDSRWGVLHTGMWYEWAYTDRYQIPTSPKTGVNAALPNFHEHFITQSTQPFVDYQLRLTRKLTVAAGVKLAAYSMSLDQYADNGKTVGNLGGVAFVNHHVTYHSWDPSFDARYRLRNNWSVYGQFATGSVIPPSSVFDVKSGLVETTPRPTTVKTFQVGTVLKFNRVTLDIDAYRSRFQNPYTSYLDPANGEPVYTKPGDSITKGFEAESNIFIGKGFNVYLNGTAGKANYVTSGLWVANAPRNTATVGFTYQHKAWDIGIFEKRIGQMYNDNGTKNQAVSIDPFHITNLFFNYTVKNGSRFRETKFRFGVTNLFDQHSIVGVTPASTASSVAAPGDVLTLLPGRALSVTMTAGYAPRLR